MYCENFGRFRERKFKKITNKAIKGQERICLSIYDSRLNDLTERIVKHYFIIAYCIIDKLERTCTHSAVKDTLWSHL